MWNNYIFLLSLLSMFSETEINLTLKLKTCQQIGKRMSKIKNLINTQTFI